MNQWVILAILGLGLGGGVWLYLSGRKSGKLEEVGKQNNANNKAEDQQDENDQEFELTRRDKSRRNKLLELIRKARGGD